MNLDPARVEDFATRYTAAWNNRNPANVAAFFSPRGILRVNGAPAEGRPAIALVAQSFMTAFPDMQLQMDSIDTQSTQAVYHWTFFGTNSGPNGTNKKVRFSGSETWTFGHDGLIADSQGQFDQTEYQRQLAHGVDDR